MNVSVRVVNELVEDVRDALINRESNRFSDLPSTVSGEISLWSFTVASTSGKQQALSRRKPPPSSYPPPSSDSPLRTPSARKAIPEFPFYQQNWFIALLFLMALGFFCLALFLYLSLDPDSGYTPASAAPSGKEGVEVSLFEFSNRIRIVVWSDA